MPLGNVHLFLCNVPGYGDNLHAIEQGTGNRMRHIRGRNEHNVAEVKRHLQEVIRKIAILFRIQYLKQCRGGIPSVIAAQLIDLI